MTKARIYQPDKNAMQSGKGKSKEWLLEFAPAAPMPVDNLMGWNGMTDTTREILLRFPTRDAAIAYAEKSQISYEVSEPNMRRFIRKAYADNFKFQKKTG